jgi:uncharacterized membrane protein
MPFEIILALVSAFFVGTSDFLAKMRHPQRHVLYSLFAMSFWGLILCTLYTLIIGEDIFYIHNYKSLLLLALSGLSNIIALLFLYVGLDRGPVSVTAPLVTLSAVFLAIKWFFMGVTLSFMGYLGGGIAVLGAIMLGFKVKNDIYTHKHILISGLFGIIAGFFFSLRLFIMQLIADDMHYSIVLTQTRFFGLVAVIPLVFLYGRHKNIVILPKIHNVDFKTDVFFPILQALTGAIGIFLLMIASVGDYTVIAPTIFSVNACFTVLWSILIFKEQITVQRMLAFGVILAGIVILKMSPV